MTRTRPRRWFRLGVRVAIIGAALVSGASRLADAAGVDRGLLWRAVQVCLANHKLTGAAFPCLQVDTSGGIDGGYAVLRAPLEDTHVVVVPTTRVVGVETAALRAPDAGNYFADAWRAQGFVRDRVQHPLRREDIGLALNSRPGRSQDQLHIHVDCVKASVRDLLRDHAADFKVGAWTRLPFKIVNERYWGTRLDSSDLAGVNVFQLVATGLRVADADRAGVTIALAGATFENGRPGFYLLAGVAGHSRDNLGHSEYVLDHSCAAG
jgi:CDP-diacylglycerol pyrophosphatase